MRSNSKLVKSETWDDNCGRTNVTLSINKTKSKTRVNGNERITKQVVWIRKIKNKKRYID